MYGRHGIFQQAVTARISHLQRVELPRHENLRRILQPIRFLLGAGMLLVSPSVTRVLQGRFEHPLLVVGAPGQLRPWASRMRVGLAWRIV